ncbi:MAG: WecB/TagA/CpsF family glycosyltransferase [Pseudomonadota bacterium]
MSTQPATTEDILGFPVTPMRQSACRDLVASWLEAPGTKPRVFACANPHSLHVARSNQAFREALIGADLLTPDGVGIVLGSRLLGGGISRRITGYDIFEDTCAMLSARRGSCFFLGSSEAVLSKIRARMARDYPRITVAGTYSPPFRARFSQAENAAMIEAVNHAKPDVLWVGMTAPKQEIWLHRHRDQLDVRFAGAIGAVFDFYAGTVPRAPAVIQHMGLEWLPRLLRQPRRLWRRNFISNPAFMVQIMRQKRQDQGA